MPASSHQAETDESDSGPPSGDALIRTFVQCDILHFDEVERQWTEGHQFDASIPPPTGWMKRGVHYSGTYLQKAGLWGSDESNKFSRDVTTLVQHCCGDWDTFKAVYDRENLATQDAIIEAIADNIFDVWGVSPGWSTSDQETYKEALKRLVKYCVTQKHKSRSETPHVAKPKPSRKGKEKSSKKPAAQPAEKPKKEEEEEEDTTSTALGRDITEPDRKRIKNNIRINKIEIQYMTLVVSRDASWDGHGLPPKHKFWQYHIVGTNDVKAAMEFIPRWLLSEEVQWDPDMEDAIILSPGPLNGVAVGYDFDTFGTALLYAHKSNATALKIKIVRKILFSCTVAYDTDVSLTPPWWSEAEEENEEEEDEEEEDEEEEDEEEEEVEEIASPAPAVPDDEIALDFDEVMNQSSSILAKFTLEEWCNARKFFGMPRLPKMINNKEKVKWIKKPLYPHQYMMMYQAIKMLEERGAMFLADEQGLGKTIMTISLTWLKNVLLHMFFSIRRFRKGKPNAQKHLSQDAATGQECPSQGDWPFQCICNPDSPAHNWVIDLRPSLVICMVKSTIPDWAGSVNDFCDDDCPFQLEAVIGHSTSKSKIGLTRRTKSAKKDDEPFDPAILSWDQKGEFLGSTPPTNHVVVTTPSSAQAWVVNTIENKAKATRVVFSLIAVDEFHQITGDSTGIVRLLEKFTCKHQPFSIEGTRPPFAQASGIPTKFVFSSGTPWKEVKDLNIWCKLAKTQMTPMLEFVERWCPKDVLKDIKAEVKRFRQCDFALEHNKIQRLLNEDLRTEVSQITTEVVQILSPIMLRRMQSTILPDSDGKIPIVPLPEFVKKEVQVTYNDQEIERANEQIQRIRDAFKSQAKTNSKGASSTFQNLETTFTREYHTSQVVATSPSLACLLQAGDFNEWLYNSAKEKKTSRNTTIKLTQARMAYQGYIKDHSGLRKKVTKTCKDDPKVTKIIEIINDIMKHDDTDRKAAQQLKKKDAANFVGTPDDYLQKIVVTAQQPMSAVVIYDVLSSAFPDMEIDLYLAIMNDKEKENIIASFNDSTIIDEAKTAKNAAGKEVMMFAHKRRPRILVGVQRVLSTGLNLQRGNHIILAEPSNNPSEVLQMEKRCHRLGQKRTCYVYDLIARNVKVEEVIRNKQEMRMFLQSVAEQVGIKVQ